jgi:hypothetical protein
VGELMSGEQKISSTTDSAEAVLAAAGEGSHLTSESEGARAEEPAQPAQEQAPQESRNGKPKSAYQKRIDHLIRERSQRDALIEDLRKENEKLKRGNDAPPRETLEQMYTADSQPEPRQAERQEAPPVMEEQRTELDNLAFQQTVRQMVQPMLQRLAQNPEKHAALEAAAVRWGKPLPKLVSVTVLDMPNSEDVLQYLYDNEDVLARVSNMPPQHQFEAIKRISFDLNFNPPEPERQPSARAITRTPPAPIRPVSGSVTRSSVPDEDLSYQEYAARRNSPGAVKERQRKGYGV